MLKLEFTQHFNLAVPHDHTALFSRIHVVVLFVRNIRGILFNTLCVAHAYIV